VTAAITTETTLKAEFLILLAELDRLNDAADFSGDTSVGLHTAAWSQVKRDLARRRVPIAETDLTDPDELQHATHLYVLYKYYSLSELEEDKLLAKQWLTKYRKEMGDLEPTLNGVETASSGESTMLVIG
jgi:hypothetical protein